MLIVGMGKFFILDFDGNARLETSIHNIVDLSLKTFALILFNVYLKSTKFHVLYVCPNLVPDI